MDVTIVPAVLNAAGAAAVGVADNELADALAAVRASDGNADSARIQGLECSAPLGSLCVTWTSVAEGLQTKTRSVGNKLVSTATTYSQTDDVSAGIFLRVPVRAHGAEE